MFMGWIKSMGPRWDRLVIFRCLPPLICALALRWNHCQLLRHQRLASGWSWIPLDTPRKEVRSVLEDFWVCQFIATISIMTRLKASGRWPTRSTLITLPVVFRVPWTMFSNFWCCTLWQAPCVMHSVFSPLPGKLCDTLRNQKLGPHHVKLLKEWQPVKQLRKKDHPVSKLIWKFNLSTNWLLHTKCTYLRNVRRVLTQCQCVQSVRTKWWRNCEVKQHQAVGQVASSCTIGEWCECLPKWFKFGKESAAKTGGRPAEFLYSSWCLRCPMWYVWYVVHFQDMRFQLLQCKQCNQMGPLFSVPFLSGGRTRGGTISIGCNTSSRGLHVPCCRSCANSISVSGLMCLMFMPSWAG